MIVTELTKEICEKHPKVWEKLENKYRNYKLKVEKNPLRIGFYKYEIIIYYNDKNFAIPFSMLYGLLEDFFDMTGKVNLKSIYDNYFRVFSDRYIEKNKKTLCLGDYVNIKNEAKKEAILKAAEILENKLED